MKFQMFVTSFLNSDMRYLRTVLSKSSPPRYVSPFVAFTCKVANKKKMYRYIKLYCFICFRASNIFDLHERYPCYFVRCYTSLADSKGNPVNPLHTMCSNFVVYMYIEYCIESNGLSRGALQNIRLVLKMYF